MMLDNLSSDSDLDSANQEQNVSKQYLKQVRQLPDMKKQPNIPKSIVTLYNGILKNSLPNMSQVCILPPARKVKKEVCAKVLKPGDLLVQCYDCRFDPSCVVCMDCFKKGNHEGHRFVIRNAAGGCCDCGDKQAWNANGFCVQHSGQCKQFTIPQPQLQQAKTTLHGLFYIYFHISISNHSNRLVYSQSLIKHLITLNSDNPYYNKMTALFLTQKLLYPINSKLDQCSVLENILKYAISDQIIQRWYNLFILLFQYYPFKMALLAAYMRGFGELVDGSQGAFRCAGSISCQIMSSHELVEKYSKQYQEGLGQNTANSVKLSSNTIKKFRSYYLRMLYDLNYLCKLKGNAPLAYWQMHIKHQTGLNSIFKYYEQIMQFCQRQRSKGIKSSNTVITLIQLAGLQEEAICNFALILKVIKNDRNLMKTVLNFLWRKCETYANTASEIANTFRSYQRCLGLTIFTYFEFSLENVKEGREKFIESQLKIDSKNFTNTCIKILKKIFHTYLLYPKTISEPGFGQSMYAYLYFYKIKFHFLSSTDIITIKTLFLLVSKQNISFRLDLICKEHESPNEEQTAANKRSKIFFNSCLTFLKYLYTFQICEAHVAYEIDPANKRYESSIADFLQRLFNEKKGSIQVQKMNQFINSLFSDKVTFINQWLKQNCIVNKEKKQFVLNKQCGKEGLQFNDLWQNILGQKAAFANPFKTQQAITGINMEIFQMIWPKKQILNLCLSILNLYCEENSQGIETILSNVLPIYLIKGWQSEEGCLLKQMIIKQNKDKIPVQIRSKLKGLFDEKIQDTKEQVLIDEAEKIRQMELKKKKFLKMKQAQSKFLSNQMEEENPILRKQSSNNSLNKFMMQQEQQRQTCGICRDDKKQNLVYLVKMEMRNSQKLLKLGNGVNCLTFSSCFHTFDYNCIKQSTNLNKIYKCPFCKTSAHILVPLCNQKAYSDIMQDIFAMALTNFHEEDLSSIEEYLLRSFYHFFLNCYINPKNINGKRANLYKTITQNFMKNLKIPEIEDIWKSTIKNYKGDKHKSTVQLARSESQQKQKIKTKIKKKTIRKVKSELKQAQKPQIALPVKKIESCFENCHSLFEIFMALFLIFVQNNLRGAILQSSQFFKIRSSCPQEKYAQFLGITIAACKLLFNYPLEQQDEQTIAKSRPKQFTILRQLPNKYSQIGGKNKCSECGELSPSMIICLICDWTGCQKCPGGISQKHNKSRHEGVAVFMEAQSSIAYYQSQQGISVIGALYENDWGHSLQKSNKWQEFELNLNKIKEIQNTLVNDRPINYRNV